MGRRRRGKGGLFPNEASNILADGGRAQGPPPERRHSRPGRPTGRETAERDNGECRAQTAASVPEQERRLRCRGQVRLETSPQRTGFLSHTIAEQPGLPQRRRDEKQPITPASEAEYLSAGIAPGNEMGVRQIEILEAASDFLLPVRFGICINSRIQAVQQRACHCRTNLWRKLQGRL